MAAVATTGAHAVSGCQATYSITSQWSTGFGVSISVTNLGSPLTSWTVGWSLPGNQRITQLWNGAFTQSGQAVSVTNLSYNGSAATGAALSFGFNGSYSGSNLSPAQFTLNGTACTGAVGSSSATPSTQPTSTSPSASASPTPSPTGSDPGARRTPAGAPVEFEEQR